jgi:hypothetical protein
MKTQECKVTLVSFDDELFGILVDYDELFSLGGDLLADAFFNHHVQLARKPNGQYLPIDDIGDNRFYCIDDVAIIEKRARRGRVGATWRLSKSQSEHVQAELADIDTDWRKLERKERKAAREWERQHKRDQRELKRMWERKQADIQKLIA